MNKPPQPLASSAPWSDPLRLISSRHNVAPKRLVAPGPSDAQLRTMLEMAAAAPDHGRLTPWRFVIVPPHKRGALAEVFARALLERDPAAADAQVAAAREKAHRAPLLMLAVVRHGPDAPEVPAVERLVSLGAAIQNLLLAAHALGFGSGLTSGRAMTSPHLRALFALADAEVPVCFVNLGTVSAAKPPRPRPEPASFCSTL